MSKKKLTAPATIAFILIAALASADAPRDITLDDTRVFPESLGARRDGTLYTGSWKGIVYRARPGEVLAIPWGGRALADTRHACITFAGIWCGGAARYGGVYRIFAAARAPASFGLER